MPDGAGPIDAAAYARIPSQPIDKAVMEQSPHVAVVPADPRWSDVGSWHAIWELMAKDEQGNARQGDTIALAAQDNLIRSEKRLVAVAGVNGLAVIETADAVMVVERQNSDAVRGVVDALVKPSAGRLPSTPARCARGASSRCSQEGAGLQGEGGGRRRPRPADLPVPSRP